MSNTTDRLAESILRWMASGQTGLSSETMAFCAQGLNQDRVSHPLDPADFNRCLLLVAQVPAIRGKFPEIAELSPAWLAVIQHWDELESLFIAEVGLDWSRGDSAPKTYKRMKEILPSYSKAKD